MKLGGTSGATQLCLVLTIVAMASDLAMAQGAGGSTFQPINTAFQSVLDFMTGGFATTAATIAVCAAGFLALTWRVTRTRL